jgi:hypothetical protein
VSELIESRRGGSRAIPWFDTEPEAFHVYRFRRGTKRPAIRERGQDIVGWANARAEINGMLTRADTAVVVVADSRDRRVTLMSYAPGDEVPGGGPHAAAEPAFVRAIDELMPWLRLGLRRRLIVALRPYMK